ncbi:SIR2 family protein [Rhodanobacter soli]|uniref:SIR2-like domain-containing protein n=1 Tax=Rhodanobacter soli TaxID=590609 RepID=A0ABV2PSW5_9GAMM
MPISDSDVLDQVEAHLRQPNQAWLLGAGISRDSGVPLMYPLTTRVRTMAVGKNHEVLLQALSAELDSRAHIEQILSQLGDYTAIAGRSGAGTVTIGGETYSQVALENAHAAITEDIAETIRWGYIEAQPANDDHQATDERIGTVGERLTTVDLHQKFVSTLFEKLQAGLHERRRPINFFTTNYDTLLEDAFALGRYRYWDGFSGGAIAFLEHRFGDSTPSDGYRAKVIKLHGSIDWTAGDGGEVFRVRETDVYPTRTGPVLIYPQSTKYVATQKDPFAAQFSELRRTLRPRKSARVNGAPLNQRDTCHGGASCPVVMVCLPEWNGSSLCALRAVLKRRRRACRKTRSEIPSSIECPWPATPSGMDWAYSALRGRASGAHSTTYAP